MMTSKPLLYNSSGTSPVAETSTLASKYYPTDQQELLGGVRRPLPLELSEEPEQQLRRKTPGGTLDAGYNATTGRLDGRKPPLKQLAVPATVDYTYYMHAVQHGHSNSLHSTPDASWQTPSIFANPPLNINHTPWANNATDHNGATVFQSPYQPVIRAHEANLGAFCPPPPHNAFGQIRHPWHLELSARPMYTGDPWGINVEADRYHAASAVDAWHERTHWPLLPTPTSGLANGFQLQHMQAETLSRTRHQDDFKEMTLTQGYSRYTALLEHVQSSGALGMRDLQHRSFRHLVFPKPPKAKRASLTSKDSDYNVHLSHASGAEHPTQFRAPMAAQFHQNNHAFNTSQHVLGSPYTTSNDNSLIFIQDIQNSIEILAVLCNQSTWTWMEGMLLLGCLHHAVEKFDEAILWFSRVLGVDSGHSESTANMAASLYCLGRYDEAEWYWIRALTIQPTNLDSAEHLVGLLYKNRSEEAIKIINNLQKSLKTGQPARTDGRQEAVPSQDHAQFVPEAGAFHTSDTGYMLSPEDNGRILALIHAKGTMLYGRKQIQSAAEAFEEAVMISTGRCLKDICDITYRAQYSNSHLQNGKERAGSGGRPASALLLTPERARQTAELVFGGNGSLPGLSHLTDKTQMRAAIHTTSNALLSLAKILQDALASGRSDVGLRRGPSGVGDILILYYLSLSLQESPSTANNVGILLAGIQQPHDGGIRPGTRSNTTVQIPGVVPGSGLELALQYYNYGLKLDPKHVHLHTNLGSLLKDVGQLDLAIQMYERAVSCDGTFDIALTNLANAVKDKGRVKDAIKYYRRAIAANPNFAEAVCGLYTALNSVCNWRGRGGAMMKDGRYDRWHVTDDGRLIDAKGERHSSGLTEAVVNIIHKQLEDAVTWGQHILNDSFMLSLSRYCQSLSKDSSFDSKSELLRWRRAPWEGTKVVRILERCTKVAMHTRYEELYLHHGRPSPQRARIRPPTDLSIPTAPTVLPFHTFTCPLSAADIRMISQRNALRISCSTLRSSWIPEEIPTPPPPPAPHLNVGYVSSDFNNHPLAHLMQSVFGLHNGQRVRAYCYATTPGDKSTYRAQIEREAPCFRDVSAWPVGKIVKQIAADNIHILVNLNGYTRGARNEIFAARAAPVQMSFMGYAGTLAAEWCDYILADSLTIPKCTLRPWRSNVTVEDVFRDNSEGMHGDWMYSENIIFCRDTFFCCDHAQSSAEGERDLTWEDEEKRRWKMRKELFPSIDNNTVILANFNQLYKIEPTIFRSWLRILASIPNAILWLLRFPEAGEANLKQSAAAWAGADVASRIVFTDVAPKGQHISRARVCDLVLDTPECNAHTTAADVLWSSTPLLTLPRYPYKMCSRMAASILNGALPRSPEGKQIASELIVSDQASYEDTAVRLIASLKYNAATPEYCTGEGRLADMRRILWQNKWTCGLFDTKRWVRDVEDAYEEAWKRWVNGEGGDIWL